MPGLPLPPVLGSRSGGKNSNQGGSALLGGMSMLGGGNLAARVLKSYLWGGDKTVSCAGSKNSNPRGVKSLMWWTAKSLAIGSVATSLGAAVVVALSPENSLLRPTFMQKLRNIAKFFTPGTIYDSVKARAKKIDEKVRGAVDHIKEKIVGGGEEDKPQ